MRDEFLDGHGSAHQPAVKGDDFLAGAAGPKMLTSKRAQSALSWGSAEITVVQIVRRGVVDEIRAVTPDELPALETELGEDPTVDHIECQQGMVEATLGDSFDA